ncbi:MAG: lipocalin family protein [Dethiobacteria bacterium]
MKKILITFFIAVVCIALISGCSGNGNNTGTAPTPSDRAESPEAVPTLDEVISGTWSLYAGYEQSGELAYVSSDSAEYTFTFDADNGFSGVYRQGDGYIDSTFTGTYDVTNSKAAYKNPYDWYYYATIEKDSIADSGESTLLGRLGEQGLHLIFKFRELDGEKLLYEEEQRLYFKR